MRKKGLVCEDSRHCPVPAVQLDFSWADHKALCQYPCLQQPQNSSRPTHSLGLCLCKQCPHLDGAGGQNQNHIIWPKKKSLLSLVVCVTESEYSVQITRPDGQLTEDYPCLCEGSVLSSYSPGQALFCAW